MDMHVTFGHCQHVSVILAKLCSAQTKSSWVLNSMLCSSAPQRKMRLSILCSIALLRSEQFSEGRIQLLLFECGRCPCSAGAWCRSR